MNAVTLELARGDITAQRVDAIVNAANSSLLGGGGVDGAIHRAGGPEILRECRALREGDYPNGLPTGFAVATGAGALPARYVVHAVGPVWSAREDRTALLESAYRESLAVAAGLGVASLAFPAISAGAYGWPLQDAARIALGTSGRWLGEHESSIRLVRFVLFSEPALDAFRRARDELGRDSA